MYLASLGLGSVVASVQILGRRAILGGVSLGWGRFLPEWARFMSTDFDMKRAFWPWWFLTLTRNMTAKSHDGPLNPMAVEIKSRTEERWARQGRDPRIPGFPEPASHAAILNILLSRGES